MSQEARTWAFMQKTTNLSSKFTLVVLADSHNGRTNQCNPSLAVIAEVCQITRRAVTRHLKYLEADGLIESKPRYGKHGRLTNQYTLNLKKVPLGEGGSALEREPEPPTRLPIREKRKRSGPDPNTGMWKGD